MPKSVVINNICFALMFMFMFMFSRHYISYSDFRFLSLSSTTTAKSTDATLFLCVCAYLLIFRRKIILRLWFPRNKAAGKKDKRFAPLADQEECVRLWKDVKGESAFSLRYLHSAADSRRPLRPHTANRFMPDFRIYGRTRCAPPPPPPLVIRTRGRQPARRT